MALGSGKPAVVGTPLRLGHQDARAKRLVAKTIIGSYQMVTKTSDSLYDFAALNEKLLANGISTGRRVLALPEVLAYLPAVPVHLAVVGHGPEAQAEAARQVGR